MNRLGRRIIALVLTGFLGMQSMTVYAAESVMPASGDSTEVSDTTESSAPFTEMSDDGADVVVSGSDGSESIGSADETATDNPSNGGTSSGDLSGGYGDPAIGGDPIVGPASPTDPDTADPDSDILTEAGIDPDDLDAEEPDEENPDEEDLDLEDFEADPDGIDTLGAVPAPANTEIPVTAGIGDVWAQISESEWQYTGAEIKPSFSVYYYKGVDESKNPVILVLEEGRDYTTRYTNNVNLYKYGESDPDCPRPTINIRFIGSFKGHLQLFFDIVGDEFDYTDAFSMSDVSVTYPKSSCVYKSGFAVNPEFTLRYNGQVLSCKESATDVEYHYSVSYPDGLDTIGQKTAVFTGSGIVVDGMRFVGVRTVTFDITGKYVIPIEKISVGGAPVTADSDEILNAAYCYSSKWPIVSVGAPGDHPTLSESDYLTQNRDYAVTYGSDETGKYVSIRGKGDYEIAGGTIKRYYVLSAPTISDDISSGTIMMTATDVRFSECAGAFMNTSLIFSGVGRTELNLRSGIDYDVLKYERIVGGTVVTELDASYVAPVGDSIRITIRDKHGEPASAEYRIVSDGTTYDPSGSDIGYIDISDASITIHSDRAYTYTGEEICPAKSDIRITCSINGGSDEVTLSEDDYEILSYFNNINAGNSAIVFLRGTGRCTGTVSVRFSIAYADRQAEVIDVEDVDASDILLASRIAQTREEMNALLDEYVNIARDSAFITFTGYEQWRLLDWISYYRGLLNSDQNASVCAIPDDEYDDTTAINIALLMAMINHGVNEYNEANGIAAAKKPTVVYLTGGEYKVTPGFLNGDRNKSVGIIMRDNVYLLMSDSAVLRVSAAPDYVEYGSKKNNGEYAVICASEKKNITIRGGEIAGEKNIHKSNVSSDPKANGHGIAVYTCENVKILNVRIHDNWGDGIYLGNQDEEIIAGTYDAELGRGIYDAELAKRNLELNSCRNVLIQGCDIYNNRRNNISIISGMDVTIDNCQIWGAGDCAPSSGIDLEPNNSTKLLYIDQNGQRKNLIKQIDDGHGNKVDVYKKSYSAGSFVGYTAVEDFTRPCLKNITISNTTIKSKRKNSGDCQAILNLEGSVENRGILGDGLKLVNCDFDGDVGCYSMTGTVIENCKIRGTLFMRAEKTSCGAHIGSSLVPQLIGNNSIAKRETMGWYRGRLTGYYYKDDNGNYHEFGSLYYFEY